MYTTLVGLEVVRMYASNLTTQGSTPICDTVPTGAINCALVSSSAMALEDM